MIEKKMSWFVMISPSDVIGSIVEKNCLFKGQYVLNNMPNRK